MMTFRLRAVFLGISAGVMLMGTPAAGQMKKPPYWASISKTEARMRTGPSDDYPANWIYRRRDLPVKVVEIYSHWRKVEDPDGTQGWMHVRLLSDQPTAIVQGGVQPLRQAPESGATVIYRAEPGVVGRISDCEDGWCLIDIQGRKGFIEKAHLWGAAE
ncbi:SH3 domain-containing protein [Rhizorhapis suberifaciens]|uniref:SH3-like domain-containing protein n=1 Tax=Rhizorhapis suberifaciens TaxID=13656 RepID=A0A840HWV8_9SPHN|nr:SH3 domain-containing protein [Rhizorhapis suberifaciens]MBB4642008.1 SH3-like domain-containing protein [Rhizorhapis suberifaciens]